MPKTYLFHLVNHPEIKVPFAISTVEDCVEMIGKTYWLVSEHYEAGGKPFQVEVESVYPEDGDECMPICVCHRVNGTYPGEKVEVGFECLSETEKEALEFDKEMKGLIESTENTNKSREQSVKFHIVH